MFAATESCFYLSLRIKHDRCTRFLIFLHILNLLISHHPHDSPRKEMMGSGRVLSREQTSFLPMPSHMHACTHTRHSCVPTDLEQGLISPWEMGFGHSVRTGILRRKRTDDYLKEKQGQVSSSDLNSGHSDKSHRAVQVSYSIGSRRMEVEYLTLCA